VFLVNTTAQPVKAHVHGFSALGLDGVVYNAEGGRIVGLDGSGWLRVAHFEKEVSQGNDFAGIDV
jgi:hypothetical protein